jgi:hypothetical protein
MSFTEISELSTGRPTKPTLSIRKDTGIDPDDRITRNRTIDVNGLVKDARWQFSTNWSQSWTNGTGSSFTLKDGVYGNGQVSVRQRDPQNRWSDALIGTSKRDNFNVGLGGYSSLGSYDRLIGFQSNDRIQVEGVRYRASLTSRAGTISSFTDANVEALLSNNKLPAGSAAAFRVQNISGTFVALNDGNRGFDSLRDGLVFLPGFNVSSTNPISVF